MTMTKTDMTTERNCGESSEDLLLITAAKSHDVQILHRVLFTHNISYCILLLCGSLLPSLLFATVFYWGQDRSY